VANEGIAFESHDHYIVLYHHTRSLKSLAWSAPVLYPPSHNYIFTRPQSPDYVGTWVFAKASVYHLLSALNHLHLDIGGTL